jgi:hypothetical protein
MVAPHRRVPGLVTVQTAQLRARPHVTGAAGRPGPAAPDPGAGHAGTGAEPMLASRYRPE